MNLWNSHAILVIGAILLVVGLAVPTALASLTVDSSPPVLSLASPGGTPGNPTLLNVNTPYAFSTTIGEDNPLTGSTVGGCTGTGTASVLQNCVAIGLYYSPSVPQPFCTFGNGCAGTLMGSFLWANGALTIATSCGSITCTPSLVGVFPGNCGQPYCYTVSLTINGVSSALQNDYIIWYVVVGDVAKNVASQNTYGFVVGTPSGYFLINGQKATATSTIVSSTNIVNFQFNATNAPNSITTVNIVIQNMTSTPPFPTKTLCYVGAGCFTPPVSTTTNYLYPTESIYFTNGNYNVTASLSCTGCSQTFRVLSLIGGFGVSTISLPVFGIGTILAIFGGIMIASDLGINVVRRRAS